MSVLLQIESKLKSLDQSTFQKLCAAYLQYEFEEYEVKEIGGSHGQNTTTTGTPDVLIDCKNGKYIFAECTIQKAGISKKFSEDLDSCFDSTKTGISVADIEQVILCHNSKDLSRSQKQVLEAKVQKHQCLIDFVDIDRLKFDLDRKYRRLCKDFLGIKPDTGQILTLRDFVKEQEQKSAIPLDNTFIGREKELKEIQTLLSSFDIITLTGKPGSGKTRLALQVFNSFAEENKAFEKLGIDNKGISLWKDLKTHFLPRHRYLLLIDDANRVGDFQHIIRLTREKEFTVKIIITVRDYAYNKIHKLLEEENYSYQIVNVEKLSHEDVQKILSSLKITNPLCIKQIDKIADGNPRLVLMAANHALKDNDCTKLNDVKDIYDRFYSKITETIYEGEGNVLFKTLGIICFFRVVRKSDIRLNERIFSEFKITENRFWDNTLKLHELELVDLYEQQIVKISDQVLATYFFYFIFIKNEILSYSILLENFLDQYPGKIKENLYPILEHFDYYHVLSKIDKCVDQLLNKVKDDERLLISFYQIFWFCKKTELLVWLQDRIERLPVPDIQEYHFAALENDRTRGKDDYLDLLVLFGHHPDEYFKLSLEILLEYLLKKPALIPDTLKYVKNNLSFKSDSHESGYFIQKELFSFLLEKIEQGGKNVELCIGFFLSIANHFLEFEFEYISSTNGKSISINRMSIPFNEEIQGIRREIWEFLLKEYKNQPGRVFEIYNHYISQSYYTVLRNKGSQLIQKVSRFDEVYIFRFFEKYLNTSNYLHCQLVHDYIFLLKRNGLDTSNYDEVAAKFRSQEYNEISVLVWDYYQKRYNDSMLHRSDFEEIKEQEILEHFENYSIGEFANLIKSLVKIKKKNPNLNLGWRPLQSLEILFVQLVKKDVKLCLNVLGILFKGQNELMFISSKLVQQIIGKRREKELYGLISKHDFQSKTRWKLHYYEHLPIEKIDQETVNEILDLYQNIEKGWYLSFDYLFKYEEQFPDLIYQVIEILLNRADNSGFSFRCDYNFIQNNGHKFKDNLPLLKRLYFYLYSQESFFDHEGTAFSIILELDTYFIIEYVSFLEQRSTYLSAMNKSINFSFIWQLQNYKDIIDKTLSYLLRNGYKCLSEHVANTFFPKSGDLKVYEYIKEFIETNAYDKDKMRLIFNVITYTYPNKRIEYLSELIKYNHDIELVPKLTLMPSSRSGSGSFVPLFQKEKEFWQEVEKLFSGKVKYLKLKQWTKEEQKACDYHIEKELERDFMDDY